MILECKSCNKKFLVPDSAITSTGRLVQCSSCGNKWTQYPIKKDIKSPKKVISEVISKPKTKTNLTIPKHKQKKSKKKKSPEKKIGPTIYSKEYLEKKHGIKINNISNNDNNPKKTVRYSMGFYSYFLIFLMLLIAFLGVLNLTKEMIIYNFPFLENYISYLFENLENFGVLFKDMFNVY